MIQASAPGKAILMGEHAAVYGRPALVAAIDRRSTATLEPAGEGERVRLELPAVGVRETTSWPALAVYARERRTAWERHAERPSPERFAAVRGTDPAHVVKVALGETALFLGHAPPACTLRLESTIPIGAGFGSSAATAVAVIYGILGLAGEEPAPDVLEALALEVERRQHGTPSGVDGATVLRGGLVWARKDEAGGVTVEEVVPRSPALTRIRVYNTGTPASSTGEVVAAVRRRVDADPARYGALLDEMERHTRELRRLLATTAAADDVVVPIRRFQALLEELGVVPAAVCELIRRIEAAGGAAKISGAGSLVGEGAGSLLVYHPGDAEATRPLLPPSCTPLDVRLGAPGARREPTSDVHGLFRGGISRP